MLLPSLFNPGFTVIARGIRNAACDMFSNTAQLQVKMFSLCMTRAKVL